MFRVVIPARFDSARLSGKVLLPIGGRPMLHWVVRTGAGHRVPNRLSSRPTMPASRPPPLQVGVECVMTAATHVSGTDRIAEAARKLQWAAGDIIVNLQADEPLMPPALIGQVARLLRDHTDADIATLAAPVTSAAEFLDPNAVKVVLAEDGRALLFSRAPIPCDRDAAIAGSAGPASHQGALRHIGLYAYRVQSLLRISQLPPTPLELREQLEQLRALAYGMQIRVAICSRTARGGCEYGGRPRAHPGTAGGTRHALTGKRLGGGRVKILFVCLGNICRSPTAEAVMRGIAAREVPELALTVDSAGTANYHPGAPAPTAARRAARAQACVRSVRPARAADN